MADDDDSSDYKVGYGRPPREHQFRRGSCANPRGRPRGSSKQSPIQKALKRKVTITVDGKRSRVPVTEALAVQTIQRGLSGNHQAAKDVLNLARAYESSAPADPKVAARGKAPDAPPKITFRVVDMPTNARDAISQALIALSICSVEGPITQIETWFVAAAFSHFGWDALQNVNLQALRDLMAQPDELDRIVRRAKKASRLTLGQS
jgi:hypothetical protein